MKILLRIITLLLAFPFSNVFADYKGNIDFSATERRNHKRKALELAQIGADCLLRYKIDHKNFYQSNCMTRRDGRRVCLSKYIGDRRYSFYPNQFRSDGEPLEYLPKALQDYGFSPRYAETMQKISCIGLALNCLEEGFEKTGQREQWIKIRRFVQANNVSGTGLQFALGKLGWKTYYWNPSPYWKIEEDMRRWDREERNWASKGWHEYRYNRVMTRGMYWYNQVDNVSDLVGFDKTTPALMSDFPFWVGTAHTGYHVFPGTRGQVVEAHSTRHFTSFQNLEFSNFNPLQVGGGPRWSRREKYRSGLIAFPPL